ncbi:MAG: hypothetical protein H6Q07_2640, partial [Acidobacteria bacterium]|nr:hypothetical protein [Acidobacteriota bacterium]
QIIKKRGRPGNRETFLEKTGLLSVFDGGVKIYAIFLKKSGENLPTGLSSRYTYRQDV